MKFNIEVRLKNTSDHLKSGLFAEVELPIKNEDKLIISKKAIVGSMKSPEVYVVKDGIARLTPIIIGLTNDKQIEVLDGLEEGNEVITDGQINLKDGDKVEAISCSL